jgi:hypothetical protein
VRTYIQAAHLHTGIQLFLHTANKQQDCESDFKLTDPYITLTVTVTVQVPLKLNAAEAAMMDIPAVDMNEQIFRWQMNEVSFVGVFDVCVNVWVCLTCMYVCMYVCMYQVSSGSMYVCIRSPSAR